MARYDITDKDDHLDSERHDWLRSMFTEREHFRIVNWGFLIDHYEVEFLDPAAETMYLLRWG